MEAAVAAVAAAVVVVERCESAKREKFGGREWEGFMGGGLRVIGRVLVRVWWIWVGGRVGGHLGGYQVTPTATRREIWDAAGVEW